MPGELQLTLLGEPRVCCDGQPSGKFVFNKSMALLAYLAMTGRPHTREALAGLMWGDMPDDHARANLRKILADLRHTLGDHLEITRQTVAFDCGAPHWLDADAFMAKLQGVRGDVDTAVLNDNEVRLLREAVELYTGDFLEGFYVREAPDFEEWLSVQRERLRQLAILALHTLARHHTARGSYSAGIEYASRLLELEPWHEEFHQQMMLLQALSGQRSAALRQYEICRLMLLKEMAAEPTAETVQLYRQIRSGEIAPPAPPSAPPHNLVAAVTPLLGREAELAALAARLQDARCRLLTLVGIPGAGKTRLALQIGNDLLNAFHDGVYVVSVSSLAGSELLPLSILQAMGVSSSTPVDFRRQLLEHLRSRQLLLVLDDLNNSPGTDDLLLDILHRAPGVKLLVTSSERLNVPGEWVQPVQGLPVPDGAEFADPATYGAGRLFVASGQRVHPGFTVGAADWPYVASICNMLDGLPLGIELAASWVRVLSLPEIAEEIRGNLDILATNSHSIPERQRSLRAVFEYAWEQLAKREQRLLLWLAVFRGGFSRKAAEEVAGADLRGLAVLVDRCLLQVNAFGRYRMHEFLRQYAGAKLDQDGEQARSAHDLQCSYYAAYLERRMAMLEGPHREDALDELRLEMANIQAACSWASRRAHGFLPDQDDDVDLQKRLCAILDEGRQMVLRLVPQAPSTEAGEKPMAEVWVAGRQPA